MTSACRKEFIKLAASFCADAAFPRNPGLNKIGLGVVGLSPGAAVATSWHREDPPGHVKTTFGTKAASLFLDRVEYVINAQTPGCVSKYDLELLPDNGLDRPPCWPARGWFWKCMRTSPRALAAMRGSGSQACERRRNRCGELSAKPQTAMPRVGCSMTSNQRPRLRQCSIPERQRALESNETHRCIVPRLKSLGSGCSGSRLTDHFNPRHAAPE